MRDAVESDYLVYGSTGKEQTCEESTRGQFLLIENCIQFRMGDGKTEQVVVLNDFKSDNQSKNAFNWTGKWSKDDSKERWTSSIQEALGYQEIYKGSDSRCIMPLTDYVTLFNSTVILQVDTYRQQKLIQTSPCKGT